MNASLAAGSGNALSERQPDRLHVTRRQVAFALVLAVLGVLAAIYTVDAVTSGEQTYSGVVSASNVYNLNFANDGKVTAILVGVGKKVATGQPLATQDITSLKAAVAADQATVNSDKAAVAQAEQPQVASAQQQQLNLQLQQAQTALTNAKNALASTTAAGQASITAAQVAVTNAQSLVNSDQTRLSQACPQGPVPPSPTLTGAQLQSAEAAFQHCQDLQAQLNKDLATLGSDEAQVPVAQTQAQQADNSAQANVNTAQAAVNLAENQLAVSTSPANQATLAQAQANLSQAESQLAQAQQALQNATLVAPGPGTVSEVFGAVGEYLGPDGVKQYQNPSAPGVAQSNGFTLFPTPPAGGGGSTSTGGTEPLVQIVGGQQQVTAQVPESDIKHLPVGHRATVSIAALNISVPAVVTSIVLSPTRTTTAVTYDVVLNLDRAVAGLLPGMSASVRAS